ncbi:MAG: HNH endonuclease [bacterium]
MGFDTAVKTKVLLWSDRHCCLCKKSCGVNIEVHHIIPKDKGGKDEIENAIPLCFDCHMQVEHYNIRHPKGNKIKEEELKTRRDQVYEEFTRHLVPPIHYKITQNILGSQGRKRSFPDVGFVLSHVGSSLSVQVKVTLDVKYDNEPVESPKGHYSGENLWNLNPGFTHAGHFHLNGVENPENGKLLINVNLSIIDQYEREHKWLPVGYIYKSKENSWFFNP